MPQQISQTIRNSFSKGLLTEFSDLNFPPDASVDELNCNLPRDGSRSRRLGVAFETGDTASSANVPYTPVVTVHEWRNVGNDPEVNYIVFQLGTVLLFYYQGTYPMADGVAETFFNLETYSFDGDVEAPAENPVSTASVNGDLIVTSKSIYPFRIYKNPSTGGLSTEEIVPRVRDYVYLSDYWTTGTLGDGAAQYDALNCGWIAPPNGDSPLEAYRTAKSDTTAVPPLTHPWYSGKDSVGDFDVTEWERIFSGGTRIINGHYVIPIWSQQDFRHASSLSDLDNTNGDAIAAWSAVDGETDEDLEAVGGPSVPRQGFTCCSTYAGRVFFSGADSKVYFSPLLVNQTNKGVNQFHQVNDPTSEEFSDLLSTDGGFISIPDATGILDMVVYGASLLVFAKNGVWRISGVDDVFKATEYSVSRVTSNGLMNPTTLVVGQSNQPFWWSFSGIHTMIVDENGFYREISVSRSTIQTFWEDIDLDTKLEAVSFYDSASNTVTWLYPATAGGEKNKLLNFNVDLGAFAPWTLSTSTTGYEVVGGFYNRGDNTRTIELTVVDSNGDTVVDSNGDTVIVNKELDKLVSSKITLIVKRPDNTFSFAEFSGTDFLDWGETTYSSYLEAGYNFMGDLGRQKNSPFITVLMKVTETGWSITSGVWNPLRPGSLKVSGYWDFATSPASNAQEAYLFRYPLVPDSISSFDYPTTNLSTRLKLRGRGKVLKVRFESSEGKDFNLLGWETVDAVNPRY